MNNNILKISKYNLILVYLMFIITISSIFMTVTNMNYIIITSITCPYLLYRISVYFNYIQNEFYKVDNIPVNCGRKNALLDISGLLNTHNIIVLILAYTSVLMYWIYCIKYITGIFDNYGIKLYIIILGIGYIVYTANMVSEFIRCITKFSNAVNGVINTKLKGLF